MDGGGSGGVDGGGMDGGMDVLLEVVRDVGFAPIPNTLALVRGEAAPDPSDVGLTAVSGLIYDAGGRILLTEVAARGFDLPGGHLDRGERPAAALRREILEETGLRLPPGTRPVLVAALVLSVAAPRPRSYPYPYPLSQMWLFAARLTIPGPAVRPLPDNECVGAAWVDATAVPALTGPRVWHALLRPAPPADR